jgi:hypothetical protein
MRTSIISLLATLTGACASTLPPTQRLADAESAMRSAREVGAESLPAARLEVKLAEEQIAQAKAQMATGDNKRADFILMRARADAELALALAREQNAGVETQKAAQQSGATFIANTPGALP